MIRIVFGFLLGLCLTVNAQNTKGIDTIGTDIYDAIYTLENNTLSKNMGTKTLSYQNFALGPVATVDLLNSLEIIVFYRDYNAIVILDKQLNPITEIQFYKTITFVTKGIVNNLWRYNDTDNRLELYDYTSKTVTASSNSITEFIPLKMESNFNSVKLIGSDKTLIFNQYLNLTDTIIHEKND